MSDAKVTASYSIRSLADYAKNLQEIERRVEDEVVRIKQRNIPFKDTGIRSIADGELL